MSEMKKTFIYRLYKIKAAICEWMGAQCYQSSDRLPGDWYLIRRDEIALGNPGNHMFIRECYTYGVGLGLRNWWTVFEESTVVYWVRENHDLD